MKVELIAALSLDGKIAQSKEQKSVEWTSKEDTRFFMQKTKEAGVVIMGRSTYETIGRPLPDRLVIALTSTPDAYENIPGQLEWVKGSPKEVIDLVRERGYTRVVVAGGAQVYTSFLDADVVTDAFLTYEPIFFGSGIDLLSSKKPKSCTQVSAKVLGPGTLIHVTL